MANEYETPQLPPAEAETPISGAPDRAAEAVPVNDLPGRTTAMGTAERISVPGQDRPLTNADVRNLGGYVEQLGEELQELVDQGAARLRQESLAQGGQEPESVEQHIHAVPPVTAGGAPGAFYGQATNYIVGERDIFASSVGQVITSYTMDSAAITADANGDKIVYEGTVLQASGAKVAPRTSGAAVGVLRHRTNCRYGDTDIGMVLGGRLNVNKLWDNGVFGSVAAGAVTQLNAMGIYLQSFDA